MVRYDTAKHEPTLAEILEDPIVQLLMERDGVDPETLLPMLDAISEDEPA